LEARYSQLDLLNKIQFYFIHEWTIFNFVWLDAALEPKYSKPHSILKFQVFYPCQTIYRYFDAKKKQIGHSPQRYTSTSNPYRKEWNDSFIEKGAYSSAVVLAPIRIQQIEKIDSNQSKSRIQPVEIVFFLNLKQSLVHTDSLLVNKKILFKYFLTWYAWQCLLYFIETRKDTL
jgi:hypothetical protein